MKIPTILMMILTIGCEPSERARDAAPVGNAVHPAVVRSVRPPHRNNHRYRLVGLPTGDRLFFDQKRCLHTLQTYATGMEAGLGTGSSTGLRCEPE